MPVLATIGAASAKGFGGFYTSSNIPGGGWIARVGTRLLYMSTDSGNNIYFGKSGGFIAKADSGGNILWQKTVSKLGTPVPIYAMQAASSTYVGLIGESGGATSYPSYEVLNPDGTVYGSIVFNTASGTLFGAVTSGTQSVYVNGRFYATQTLDVFFRIVDKTVYAQKFYINSYNSSPYFIGGGSGDTAYIAAKSVGFANNIGLVKVNSSISNLWVSNSDTFTGYIQCVEVNGVVYAIGGNGASGIVKLDATSGNQIWVKTFSPGSFNCIAADSSGFVYIGGSNSSNSTGILLKIDSSGSLVWQKSFSLTPLSAGNYATVSSIVVNNTNNSICVQIIPQTAASDVAILFSVPNDGSLTGTYNIGGSQLVYGSNSGAISSANHTFYSTVRSWGALTGYPTGNLVVTAATSSITYSQASIP